MRTFGRVFWATACKSASFFVGLGLYWSVLQLTGDVNLAVTAQRWSSALLFAAAFIQGLVEAYFPKWKRQPAADGLEWVIQFGPNGNVSG